MDQLGRARERRRCFLERAQEAEICALAAQDERMREAWRGIALSWRDLARQVMRYAE